MSVCVRGQWEVSKPDLVRRVWRRKTWLEVTLGKGEKMRKGLPGAFDSKDPPQHQAPNTSSSLPPPHPTLEEKRSRAAVSTTTGIQTTTGPVRRVSGAGCERDSGRERGREWQGSEGWGPGLAAQASLRWGRARGGEQLGGTPPHLPQRGCSTDHRNFKARAIPQGRLTSGPVPTASLTAVNFPKISREDRTIPNIPPFKFLCCKPSPLQMQGSAPPTMEFSCSSAEG